MKNLKYILILILIAMCMNACSNKEMESAKKSSAPSAPVSTPPDAMPPAVGTGAGDSAMEEPTDTGADNDDIAMEPPTDPASEASPPPPPKPRQRAARPLKRAVPAPALKNGYVVPPPAADDQINSYLVKVEANRKIKMSIDADIPTSGQLDVWIGQPRFEPKNQEGMNAASSVLNTSSVAISAMVTPGFPDDPSAFKVAPPISKCMAVEPTGSTARF